MSVKKKEFLNKLERLLFFTVILFLPAQLGKHFWPPFAFVEGLRVDYLSLTLYVTDILILLLFTMFMVSELKNRNSKLQITNYKLLITFFAIFLLFGILLSQSPMAGVYKLVKLVEFGFFGFYIARNVSIKKDFPTMLLLLAIGVLFESILAMVQFAKQSSFGGVFWLFGERLFNGQTPGIANASINGALVLRPYGTFPHPNVLAGYLIIAMAMIISNLKSQISNLKKTFFAMTLSIGTVALFLTMSRVAIVLWMFVGGWLLVKKLIIQSASWRTKFIICALVILTAIIGVVAIATTPLLFRFTSILDVDQQSLIRRQELNSLAIEMFKRSPFIGVGLNNFLVQLPQFQKPVAGPLWLQPVHNIYLLILAETGIVGLVIFLWFMGKTYVRIMNNESGIKNKKLMRHNSYFIILTSILILGLFDHYFLTLQQGELLFALVFGIAWAKEH